MKLTPSGPQPGATTLNLITGYGSDYVMVNQSRHATSLIVLPERVVAWATASYEALTRADFERLAELDPEILLLGTGPRLRFPRPELVRPIVEARVGMEVMDLHAACRTYNFLMAESRKVVAALLLR